MMLIILFSAIIISTLLFALLIGAALIQRTFQILDQDR